MNKQEAKRGIAALIEKYNAARESNQLKDYSEQDTKNAFITPLFGFLGWNIENRNEMSAEEFIKSAGRIDYGFYVNGRAKFFLEAKQLTADLHREEFAHQAIRYAWNKGVTWAVLTDFESIKVFNAEAISEYLGDKLVFQIPYDQYIEQFEKLWQLSREAFEEDQLDKYAEQIGKKLQKIPVSELLYKDLNECRNILLSSLRLWNGDKNITNELLEEGVQKLIDRLIFIRVLEDRGIEPSTLRPLIREWEALKNKNELPLYKYMVSKFRELDDTYNSNLFISHPFEEWEEYSNSTKKVIEILYGKKGYYEYDFKAMPADVLGNVYENYLGRILSQSKKGIEITADPKKRKEQGIYYTPAFIVDYIVGNALMPVLDKCETITDLKKIKVLDPACGSGSFLIRALEVINEKYKELGAPGDEFTKLQILTENIYGVDLDEQAVEIARLNLLINALNTRMKLPTLSNIKNGNSLISGTDEELKRCFGRNFRNKKPFNWQEQYPEVFSRENPGFDVIIGNPPYIQLSMEKDTDESLKAYLIDKYGSSMGRLNTFGFFIKLGLDLGRYGGNIGFIIPNTVLTQEYYEKLRISILEQSKVKSLVNFDSLPFKDAVVENTILILEKTDDREIRDKNLVNIHGFNDLLEINNLGSVVQYKFQAQPKRSFKLNSNTDSQNLIDKILIDSVPFGEFLHINQAIALKHDRKKWVSNEKLDDQYKPLLIGGRNIDRYIINWDGSYLKYDKIGIHSGGSEEKFLTNEKLYFRRVGVNLVGALDENQFYGLHTLVVMTKKEKVTLSLRFLLALFNSKLMNFYYRNELSSTKKVFSEIGARQVAQLPVRKPSRNTESEIINLVNRIMEVKKEINNSEKNTNKWNQTKNESERIEKKIDEEIYKLYGLTEEEISIVETHS